MRIKRFNESTKTEEIVEIDENEYMTVGHLVEYLRKNFPKETLLFHSYPDAPIQMIKKDEASLHFNGTEDMYIYESIDKEEHMIDEFGLYNIFTKEEQAYQRITGKKPLIVKGFYINRYL
jgi:hypothetical protein